jgi:chemotaxis response regulator CheB
MPNEAIKKNAVDKILPLEAIARTLLQKCNKSQT